MIDKETDIRPIGYGAMLIEGVVGIMALVAATAMHPGDYFAINTTPAAFANLGIPVVNLPSLEARSARPLPAVLAARCRWRSGSRRSSPGCPACAD